MIKIWTTDSFYSWEIGSDHFKLLSNFKYFIQIVKELHDGTILTIGFAQKILQLNDDGSVKMEVSKIIESFAGIFLETSDHKLFISLIINDFKEIYVYQLNNA